MSVITQSLAENFPNDCDCFGLFKFVLNIAGELVYTTVHGFIA